MSALPRQVQKQIEAANQIAEEITKQRKAAEAPPPAEGETPPAPTAEAPPVESPPPTPPAAEAPPPPAPPASPDPYEQKYKVLQGKYNAEVPRLQNQLREAMNRIENLTAQVTATQGMMANLGRQGAAAPAADTAPPTRLVKEDEIRDFGPDLYDFIKRTAQEVVAPEVEARIKPMAQQVEQVRSTTDTVARHAAKTEQERLLETLDDEVPEWKALNEDEKFLDWLDQVDPYSGNRRGQLLQEAYRRHDSTRVVAFFKGFLNENAVVTQPAAAAQAPPTEARSQRSLEDFVAPGTPKAGATGAPNEAGKRIWSRAEITKFYEDCSAGKYAKNATRRAELEKDIFMAQREGRIR